MGSSRDIPETVGNWKSGRVAAHPVGEKKKRLPLIIMLAFTLREYSCSRWGVCHMGLLLVKPFRRK